MAARSKSTLDIKVHTSKMIEIRHDFIYQDPRSHGNMVNIG